MEALGCLKSGRKATSLLKKPVAGTMYIHIARICGTFPVQNTINGGLKLTWLSIPTLYTLLVTLIYQISVLDYMYVNNKWHREHMSTLSEMMLDYPATISMAGSDLTIRLAAVAYCQMFIELTEVLQRLQHGTFMVVQGPNRSKFETTVYVGLGIYAIYGAFSFVAHAALFPEDSYSILCNQSSCTEYRLMSTLIFVCDLWHDGAILSATLFISVHGFRLVKVFGLICASIQGYCDAVLDKQMFKSYEESLSDTDMPKLFVLGSNDFAEVAKKQFCELRSCFESYSKIGGTFALALFVEIVAVLFYAAGSALLNSTSSVADFLQPFIYNLATLGIFLVIVEVGNYMENQLSNSMNELQDILTGNWTLAPAEAKAVKRLVKRMLNWKWQLTALNVFSIDRRLIFGVFTAVLSHVILVFQLKMSENGTGASGSSYNATA